MSSQPSPSGVAGRRASRTLGFRALDRLPISYKALLVAVVWLSPTISLTQFYTSSVSKEVAFAQLERCGLKYDAHLRSLLAVGTPLAAAGADPAETIRTLRNSDTGTCRDNAILSAVIGSMADRLEGALASGSTETFLDAVADARSTLRDSSNLILDPELDTYYLGALLFVTFPEELQLLRSSEELSTASIESRLKRIEHAFPPLYFKDALPGGGGLRHAAAGAFNRYREALDQATDTGSTTGALEALFALAETSAQLDDEALQARIAHLRKQEFLSLAFGGGFLLIAAWLTWLTMRSVTTRVAALISASEYMSRGDLEPDLRIEGRDEISSLQLAFTNMARELRETHTNLEQRVAERTEAAEAAEARFRAVIEAAPDAFIVTDESGTIVLANAQTEQMFGYPRSELLGQRIEMLVPKRLRDRHASEREAFFQAPSTRAMGAGRDLHGVRKDGSELPIEIGLNAIQTTNGRFILASVIDITERKATERLLREADANELRSSILQSFPSCVIATDIDGTIVAANPAAEHMLGYTQSELIGQPATIVHESDELRRRAQELSIQLKREVTPDFDVVVASVAQSQSDEREWTYRRKDGSEVPVQLAITALHTDAGALSGYLKVAHDISARKRAEDYIHHMAYHDPLTGLPNRMLLLDRLEMALNRAEREGHQVAVLMMDIDHFKRINDSLGHLAGDRLLITVADRLERGMRSVDTVARLGGDEFVILVPDIHSRDDAETIIAKVIHAVSDPLRVEGKELSITPSLGGCMFPGDGRDAMTLLKKCDTAMYEAKAQGRNTVRWFAESMLVESKEKLELGMWLRHAIDRGELSVHYQPELSLHSHRLVGLEALLRWRRGDQYVPPTRFIPIAEETGLILPLGEWVLRRACQDCVRLQQRVGRRLTVAVNVSPAQFAQPDWLEIVQRALDESGLHPNQLELEITENMLMRNPEDAVQTLREIRKIGVGIVIDDFGTGYSSLAYLTRFPIDKIKIDRSFVHNLTSDSTGAAVIDSVIAMAQRLGIRVIAEGVEQLAQQRYLEQRGCSEVQGFLYGPGIPVSELPTQLEAIEAACAPPEDDQWPPAQSAS